MHARAASGGTACKLSRVDLVIFEGYKSGQHRKIEVHRATNRKPFLFPDDPGMSGIVSAVEVETDLPTAHLDDIHAVATMMWRLVISTRRCVCASRRRKLKARDMAQLKDDCVLPSRVR